MPIYFVTSNPNKVREAEAILQKKLNKISLDIPEIQTLEAEEVVKDKAKKAYQKIKKPVLVEDTAFHIHSLNNFPGALIKWALQTLKNDGICNLPLNNKRKATVKTCFCLYNGKKFHIFQGQLSGKVARKPRGTTNFGWDPIFIPQGQKKTFAEMTSEQKNKISMRCLALKKLKKFLEKIKN